MNIHLFSVVLPDVSCQQILGPAKGTGHNCCVKNKNLLR